MLCRSSIRPRTFFDSFGIEAQSTRKAGASLQNAVNVSYPEENPQSKHIHKHKLSPHTASPPGFEMGPNWSEARALNTTFP